MTPVSIDQPASAPRAGAEHDWRLTSWLAARTDAEASCALGFLLEEIAKPVLTRVVRGRFATANASHEVEDIIAETRLQIIRRLQQLRAAPPGGASPPLLDFQAYVASVAYTTWAGSVRRRNPARAGLVDRLRYLLEGRTNQRGFALWTNPGGESWAGFETWRDREQFITGTGEKAARLLADPAGMAAQIFGANAGCDTMPLPEIVGGLFAWLGQPLRLRDLVDVVGPWLGVQAGGMEALAVEPPAPGPSPHDELRWKEYLSWLLNAVGRLTLPQRSAFLLHSSCLHELERLGLTGIRQTAPLLNLTPEQMAGYWTRLPLEDRVIGTIIGLGTQQVINLRKAARVILGRAWQCFLQGN